MQYCCSKRRKNWFAASQPHGVRAVSFPRLKLLKPRSRASTRASTSSKISFCIGFAWPDFGGTGGAGMVPMCLMESRPACSKRHSLLSVSDGGGTSGIRVKKAKKETAQLQPEKGGRPCQKNISIDPKVRGGRRCSKHQS